MHTIRLIHTNDLHSRLDVWPYMASVIRQARTCGHPSLYLDAGDYLDLSEQTTYLTRGQVAVDLLAQAGCGALAVGNNEGWRMRVAETSDLAARSPFPWLCANVRDGAGRPLPGIRDWSIVQVGAVKVGLFSLTAYYPHFAEAMGLTYTEMEPTVRRCADELRAAGADIVVFLSHLGLEEDRRIAAWGAGVDVIVGGHSHLALEEPEVVEAVPIVQAGSLGSHVGVLDLEVDLERRCLTGWTARLMAVDPAAGDADPAAETTLGRLRQAAADRLDEVITVLEEPLPYDDLAVLAAEAMRRRAGAELGLMVGAQVVRGLERGPVTRRDVMDCFQALWAPSLLEISGRTLIALLEQSQDPDIYTKRCGVGGLRPYGLAVGKLYPSGLESPLDPDRIYRVGGISMMCVAESGYPAFAEVKVVKRYMPELVHELMAEMLSKHA